MKTKLTLALEKTLYHYWEDLGCAVVEEVTMPDAQGIVDTLVLQPQPDDEPLWRCFELKVTKSDFHSAAKLSFVGDYNYFVLPAKLYTQVQNEIPPHIGVMVYRPFDPAILAASTTAPNAPGELTVVKPPRRQKLQVPGSELMLRFVASLNREVVKAKQVDKGLTHFSDDQLLKELKRRSDHYDIYDPAANLYDRFAAQLQTDTIDALQDEVDALASELAQQKLAQTTPHEAERPS